MIMGMGSFGVMDRGVGMHETRHTCVDNNQNSWKSFKCINTFSILVDI
jgi:hypothetical protein